MAKTLPNQGGAEAARRKHLEILLARLTAHADVVRHHLPGTTHNATLGHAAEAGVRDVLRQVLPQRLAVTSGFVRKPGGRLIAPTGRRQISPQTDIIIYDALRTSPLYGVDGVDVISAPDVVGVIEVKDSRAGEADLSPRRSPRDPEKFVTRGALEHMKRLAGAAKRALRAIVLIQGGDAAAARQAIKKALLTEDTVPHVLYCRGLSADKSYLAFYDYVENQVRFYVYEGDPTSAFAGFLRIVTNYCAAEGLCSTSVPSDLRPRRASSKLAPLQLRDRGGLQSLLGDLRNGARAGDDGALAAFVEPRRGEGLLCASRPVVGVDQRRYPTAGRTMEIEWLEGGRWERRGSFFTISDDKFTCIEPSAGPKPWIVGAPIKEHVRRVCGLEEGQFVERLGVRKLSVLPA